MFVTCLVLPRIRDMKRRFDAVIRCVLVQEERARLAGVSKVSERSPAPLRHATKKVRMISRLLIMVQDSIYRQPGLTESVERTQLVRRGLCNGHDRLSTGTSACYRFLTL
jgi:hypothetical protein